MARKRQPLVRTSRREIRTCQQLHFLLLLPMLLRIFNLLISSVFSAYVNAKPLVPPPPGRIVPINRSFRHKPPVHAAHSSNLPLFNPAPVVGSVCQLKSLCAHTEIGMGMPNPQAQILRCLQKTRSSIWDRRLEHRNG